MFAELPAGTSSAKLIQNLWDLQKPQDCPWSLICHYWNRYAFDPQQARTNKTNSMLALLRCQMIQNVKDPSQEIAESLAYIFEKLIHMALCLYKNCLVDLQQVDGIN